MASSDGHDGHPGFAQSPQVKHHHLYHPFGSGLIGVPANSLTRDKIFGNMKSRFCYGTTGAPILLHFTLNDSRMGSETSVMDGSTLSIHANTIGACPIDFINIIKNGQVLHRVEDYEKSCLLNLTLQDSIRSADGPIQYYYIRVQQIDGETAWSSPIWVDCH